MFPGRGAPVIYAHCESRVHGCCTVQYSLLPHIIANFPLFLCLSYSLAERLLSTKASANAVSDEVFGSKNKGNNENPKDKSKAVASAGVRSGSSPVAVAHVRTIQDVKRELDTNKMMHNQAKREHQTVFSAYSSALTDVEKDPRNQLLASRLAQAEKDLESSARSKDTSARVVGSLAAELDRLKVVAKASCEQKSKYLLS